MDRFKTTDERLSKKEFKLQFEFYQVKCDATSSTLGLIYKCRLVLMFHYCTDT